MFFIHIGVEIKLNFLININTKQDSIKFDQEKSTYSIAFLDTLICRKAHIEINYTKLKIHIIVSTSNPPIPSTLRTALYIHKVSELEEYALKIFHINKLKPHFTAID